MIDTSSDDYKQYVALISEAASRKYTSKDFDFLVKLFKETNNKGKTALWMSLAQKCGPTGAGIFNIKTIHPRIVQDLLNAIDSGKDDREKFLKEVETHSLFLGTKSNRVNL